MPRNIHSSGRNERRLSAKADWRQANFQKWKKADRLLHKVVKYLLMNSTLPLFAIVQPQSDTVVISKLPLLFRSMCTTDSRGPFKKYVTLKISIFDSPPPCHTLSSFALTPSPLVTTQIVTNFLTQI